MVYPVLKINQDDYEIEFIDTEGNSELILQFEPEDSPELFYLFLEMSLSQYNDGYCKGYEDAIDDLEGDDWYDQISC